MSLLLLNPEQEAALRALTLARDRRRVALTLAEAFPDVATRLADRLDGLVELGQQRALAWGLAHGLAVGRYLACWFALGAEFESKPGHAWALSLLSGKQPEGSKIFQLCQRTREALQQLPAGAAQPAPAAFEAALQVLDQALLDHGEMGSLLPRQQLRLGQACDIDALDFALVAQGWRQQYRLQQGQLRREACAADGERLTVVEPDGLPEQLHLLSQPQGALARLRLRCRASHSCDLHPWISLNGPQGQLDWRGTASQDIGLDLPAQPGEPGGIAVESSPSLSLLTLAGCGLRHSGPAHGERRARLAVYPATQQLLAWRRDAGAEAELQLPGSLPAAPTPRCHLERDGQAQDSGRWSEGLAKLDRQLARQLASLLSAWERVAGVSDARLQARPALMVGTAGLTWGYADNGLAAAPQMRVEALLDLVLWQLELTLSGRLCLDGAQSLLTLRCQGREQLQQHWQRSPEQPELLRRFSHPFELHAEPLAQPELAMLNPAGPVSGALVGSCGLRQNPAGAGLQWFAQVAIEPVSVTLSLGDPLLGEQTLQRPLLPALTLIDWSMA